MPTPFLSSEEYDERAHNLYNEGQYDEALDVLREGLALYPHAVELHIGVGYARLAREEYAWAHRSFSHALALEPDHEDALAGAGETMLWFGRHEDAVRTFRRTVELGYQDDIELMLQIGRALFRAGLMSEAREFFEHAVREASDNSEAVACLGYALHRLGREDEAIATLERALALDDDHAEARIYLANILYDRNDWDASLQHLERTGPDDHWEELGIWRLIELKKSAYRLKDDDPALRTWEERVGELAGEPDDIDEMLAEVEERVNQEPAQEVHGQLELFGTLLQGFADRERDPSSSRDGGGSGESARGETHRLETHRIQTRDGREFVGSWEQIVGAMRDSHTGTAGRSVEEFMGSVARQLYSAKGIDIPTSDAESFLKATAKAGLIRIVR
jgi:tetratricopeptide (TPR) repeat protein